MCNLRMSSRLRLFVRGVIDRAMKTPAEPKDRRLHIMVSAREIAALDDWRRRQSDLPSRSEALRRMMALALQ